MRAAIMHAVHRPLTFEDAELDEPGDREVLVRTAASGVCHSDLHYVEDLMPMQTPAILGHEAAGVVEAVGPRVTYVRPGDHVIACGSAFCGECAECLTGHPNRCADKPFRTLDDPPRITLRGQRVHNSLSNIASFAERMLLHERGVVKVREDLPLDVASLVGCGVITGVGAVLNAAKVEPGSSVAVFGVGGVGLSAVQGAYISGARRIIAVDLVDAKLDTAREFGATDGVNAAREDPVEAVQRLSGGGVDYSFEAIGNAAVALQCVQSLGVGGTATIIGVIPATETIALGGRMLSGEKSIRATTMGSNRFRVDMPKLIDLYMQGRLRLDEMITHRGGLEEVNDMFESMKRGEVARQVIVFG